MKEIVFATSNKAKVDQINFIVQYFKFPIKIIVGKEIYGEKNNYKEIGNTVSEIAKNGAIDISKKINLPVITEDTFDKFPSWISPYTHHFGGGYNAIFIPNGWNKTLAEISPEESIPWSYREKNFIDVIKYILEECSM